MQNLSRIPSGPLVLIVDSNELKKGLEWRELKLIKKKLQIIYYLLYIAKNFKSSKTKKAGQTNDFNTPTTPAPKLVAVEM